MASSDRCLCTESEASEARHLTERRAQKCKRQGGSAATELDRQRFCLPDKQEREPALQTHDRSKKPLKKTPQKAMRKQMFVRASLRAMDGI